MGSRLPLPPTSTAGLTELSDSQNNSRMPVPQSVSTHMMKGIKRETPQPGTSGRTWGTDSQLTRLPAATSESKRKLLAERAGEYQRPSTATASTTTSTTRFSNIKGQSLTNISSGVSWFCSYTTAAMLSSPCLSRIKFIDICIMVFMRLRIGYCVVSFVCCSLNAFFHLWRINPRIDLPMSTPNSGLIARINK